jgi:hypothetical protein
LIAALLHKAEPMARVSHHEGFKAAWNECDKHTVLKHLDNDAPDLQVCVPACLRDAWGAAAAQGRTIPTISMPRPLTHRTCVALTHRTCMASALTDAHGCASPGRAACTGAQRAVVAHHSHMQLWGVHARQLHRVAGMAQLTR